MGSQTPKDVDADPPPKATIASRREAKKREREKLLASAPTVHPVTGAKFNKAQIRRMMRRAKAGLPFLETEEELQLRRKKQKTEEWELRELLFDGEREEKKGEEEGGGDAGEATEEEGGETDGEKGETEGEEAIGDDGRTSDDAVSDDTASDDADRGNAPPATSPPSDPVPPDPKYLYAPDGRPYVPNARVPKPVKAGYVCNACKDAPILPPHWILDCPLRLANVLEKKLERAQELEAAREAKGANPAKKSRERHGPRVFVSGLPFSWGEKDVVAHFEQALQGCGGVRAVRSCELQTFGDSGRCTGQAILTLATDGVATQAIRRCHGTTVVAEIGPGKKGEDGQVKGGAKSKTRECVLKVSKAHKKMGKVPPKILQKRERTDEGDATRKPGGKRKKDREKKQSHNK